MQFDWWVFWGQIPFALGVLVWRAGPSGLRGALDAVARGRDAGWLLAMLAIVPANLVLTAIDPWFSRRIPLDFATLWARYEGRFLPAFQAWTPWPLTALAALVYAAGFPALVLSAVARGLAERPGNRALRLVAAGFVANYALALPFYAFVPVTEVHAVLPSVRALLVEASPSLAVANRPVSGIDNCFPSLHTSITVTILLAMPRRRRGDVALGAAIVATTLYLGIHWMSDVAAGLAFGVLCHRVALLLTSAETPSCGSSWLPAPPTTSPEPWRCSPSPGESGAPFASFPRSRS